MKKNFPAATILIILLLPGLLLADTEQGHLSGKKIVMIIAPIMFNETEFQEPKAVFERAGAQVSIACSTLDHASSISGNLKVKPDILIYNVRADDVDAVVFVGGIGAGQYFDDSYAHRIANQVVAKGKIAAAICIAPRILANAGVLKGKKVAGTDGYLKIKGAILTDKNVCRDGHIITASGPSASKEFGEAIASALGE